MSLESVSNAITSSQSQTLPSRSYKKESWADLAIMVSFVGGAVLAGCAIGFMPLVGLV
ncbi:MAG: hypothetical protein H0W50_05225 [Parachlamydiaceae bacterium]|nr:hypothetical protein [Parachlamydiaceae bacterium]